ncbi:hypothetical protein A464_2891 [Salmonella bongori N268-08]|uniref:Uncharacterized protein n=1 Tax=Salmonella bongori N268-08 TaxID=1197719 RepID=S5MTN0_SALBN|nr:hypothetical protein A464_2891 [Salmonella bongori N268-08]
MIHLQKDTFTNQMFLFVIKIYNINMVFQDNTAYINRIIHNYQ